jgi:hypothetical protein
MGNNSACSKYRVKIVRKKASSSRQDGNECDSAFLRWHLKCPSRDMLHTHYILRKGAFNLRLVHCCVHGERSGIDLLPGSQDIVTTI